MHGFDVLFVWFVPCLNACLIFGQAFVVCLYGWCEFQLLVLGYTCLYVSLSGVAYVHVPVVSDTTKSTRTSAYLQTISVCIANTRLGPHLGQYTKVVFLQV